MKKNQTQHRRIAVELSITRKGVNHQVVATRADYETSRWCRAWDLQFAIADALHCSRIYFATPDVEHDVLRAEMLGHKIKLLLVGETLIHRDERVAA